MMFCLQHTQETNRILSWSLSTIPDTKAIQIMNKMYGVQKIYNIMQIMKVTYRQTTEGYTTVKSKM